MRIRRPRAVKEHVQASAEYQRAVYLLRRLGLLLMCGALGTGAFLLWVAPQFGRWTAQESSAVLLPWMMWCVGLCFAVGALSVLCAIYVQKLRWWAWATAVVLAHVWIVSGVLLVPGLLLRRSLLIQDLELAAILGSIEEK
jgi:hypothetical protein